MKNSKRSDWVATDEKLNKQKIVSIMSTYVQDIIYGLACGERFSKKQTEKFFKVMMKDLEEKK